MIFLRVWKKIVLSKHVKFSNIKYKYSHTCYTFRIYILKIKCVLKFTCVILDNHVATVYLSNGTTPVLSKLIHYRFRRKMVMLFIDFWNCRYLCKEFRTVRVRRRYISHIKTNPIWPPRVNFGYYCRFTEAGYWWEKSSRNG